MFKKQLTICLPHPDTLITENKLFRNSILTKIQTHLEKQPKLPEILQKNIATKWRTIEITPALVYYSYALKSQDLPIELLIDSCEEKFESPFSLITASYSKWVKNVIILQNNSLDRGEEKNTLIHTFNENIDLQKKSFQQAFLFLKQNWPESAFCIETMIKCIILVDSEAFWSSSVPIYQGAILVAPKSHWNLIHYVETLVHESAHQELNIRRMLDPLIKNPKEIAYSSFRKSNRPLLGILHAAFVLIRTKRALSFFQPHHLQQQMHNCIDMQKNFSYHLKESLQVLEKSARFTSIGNQLFKNMCLEAETVLCK